LAALKELRNNTVFAFYIINALYVTVVFLLTLEKESVYIRWPFGEKYTMNYRLVNNNGFVN
jgi:chitin synthase